MIPLNHDELKRLLKAIGMKAYVEILFPALMKDREITVMELCRKFPDFNQYTLYSQNTRWSKARKIFDNGWQFEALKSISLSSRTAPNVRTKAKELDLKYSKANS